MKTLYSYLLLSSVFVPFSRANTLSPELDAALKSVRAVGPEGRGNAEASGSWKTLSSGDASTLIPLLEAMDGANDFALNWIRAAVDAVAGRELKAGGKLPLPELGKFLLDTGHNPRARRLAFALIAKVDPATTDTLLAGMLNDPSLEIRHDAVEKLEGQAKAALASGNKTGAALLWRQALNHARDVGQIEGISQKLNELGQPVDLLKLFGFLPEWKIIGPFDNKGNKGFTGVYPPETNLDFAAELDGKNGKTRWRDYATKHPYGMVDMNQPYGKLKEVFAYAATEFHSDKPQAVELRLGGKNSWKVWLNGQLLFGRDEYHANAEIDQYTMPAQLRAGRNVILVKVCQNDEVKEWTEQWEFQLRVTDSLGTPIFSTAKPFSAAAAGARSDSQRSNP